MARHAARFLGEDVVGLLKQGEAPRHRRTGRGRRLRLRRHPRVGLAALRPGLHQQFHDLPLPAAPGKVQRRLAVHIRRIHLRTAIEEAKLPIEGLGLADGEVLFNGNPLDQASDAEQLRVSMAIAAAMSPTLRVIIVRDGSLLDEEGLKIVAQWADERDMQVWMERVDSSGTVGFYIEDGSLAAASTAEDERDELGEPELVDSPEA